jgi:subtilisin family serine protease
VVNLSLDFGPSITSCTQIPTVCKATRLAARRGVLVVGAAGNDGGSSPEMPAAAPHVLSVSASTADGCLADSSNEGALIVAPGGGTCGGESSPILQFSLKPAAVAAGNFTKFGFVSMSGTSQSAAEVSAAAALVISSGVLGTDPGPRAVARRLRACASAAGILDAGRATAPGAC